MANGADSSGIHATVKRTSFDHTTLILSDSCPIQPMGGAFVFPFGGPQDGWPPRQGYSWTLRRTMGGNHKSEHARCTGHNTSPYCTLPLNPPRRGLVPPLLTDEKTEADRAGNQPERFSESVAPLGFKPHHSGFRAIHVSSKPRYPSEFPGGP